MLVGLNRTSDAASEPITTAEAKTHLRVDHSDDDTYIDALIAAARINAEDFCCRAFITQTWVATFDCLNSEKLRLPRPQLISVSSVQYRDSDGNLQVTSSSDYEVNTDKEPGIIRFTTTPAYDAEYENPLRVTYTAGFGANASDVPESIKAAIKLMVGHWYETREGSTSDALKETPMGVQWLLNPYRHLYS